jgi:hypothetical protein
MNRQSGQALIETLYAFPIGLMMFTLIIWSMASGWSLFWVEYQLQDAVICLSDSASSECRLKHEKLIQQGAIYLKISSLVLEKRTSQLYGQINFSLPFSGKQNFKLEKIIPWPMSE